MSELVETTNWGMTKRHLVEPSNLTPRGKGREGYPLCGRNHKTWDQDYKDENRRLYSAKPGPRISDLPLCVRCAKKAGEVGVS